jgi:hypothetical protein
MGNTRIPSIQPLGFSLVTRFHRLFEQISGADAIVDIDPVALVELEKVQKTFLRRLMGLGSFSMFVPLFTELGLLHIRYRQLILMIHYVRYVVDWIKRIILGWPWLTLTIYF